MQLDISSINMGLCYHVNLDKWKLVNNDHYRNVAPEIPRKDGLNEFITNLVQTIDDGKSKPSLENLKLFEEKTMEIFNQGIMEKRIVG